MDRRQLSGFAKRKLKKDKDARRLATIQNVPGIESFFTTSEECGMGSLHIWKGTINAERYIQVLEQHMLPSRRRLFQGRPCIFQHDNARPHTASITTSWLRRRRNRVLKWPACSPDLSPIDNIGFIIKRKM